MPTPALQDNRNVFLVQNLLTSLSGPGILPQEESGRDRDHKHFRVIEQHVRLVIVLCTKEEDDEEEIQNDRDQGPRDTDRNKIGKDEVAVREPAPGDGDHDRREDDKDDPAHDCRDGRKEEGEREQLPGQPESGAKDGCVLEKLVHGEYVCPGIVMGFLMPPAAGV
jgi:hypothetical protein